MLWRVHKTNSLPDPEVSTLTTLTNVQNSLFVPDLGRWVNRRPTYTLSSRRSTMSRRPPSTLEEREPVGMTPIESVGTETPVEGVPEEYGADAESVSPAVQRTWSYQRRPEIERTHSISSVVTDSHFAVLPHGMSLEGWSEEDKEALDDHVRHMMHSKRSKFKYSMIAFGKYVRQRKSKAQTIHEKRMLIFRPQLWDCLLHYMRFRSPCSVLLGFCF